MRLADSTHSPTFPLGPPFAVESRVREVATNVRSLRGIPCRYVGPAWIQGGTAFRVRPRHHLRVRSQASNRLTRSRGPRGRTRQATTRLRTDQPLSRRTHSTDPTRRTPGSANCPRPAAQRGLHPYGSLRAARLGSSGPRRPDLVGVRRDARGRGRKRGMRREQGIRVRRGRRRCAGGPPRAWRGRRCRRTVQGPVVSAPGVLRGFGGFPGENSFWRFTSHRGTLRQFLVSDERSNQT